MMEGPRKRGTRGGTGPASLEDEAFSFLADISHEARLEDDFRFAFFFNLPHSLSEREEGEVK